MTNGQCDSFTVNHNSSNGVAPVNQVITYQVDYGVWGEPGKCWITQNLGAVYQATAKDDINPEVAGWYWQFNRRQGYSHDGAIRTPATTWIVSIDENSDWMPTNDPCSIELGEGWRIPTYTEWRNVDRYYWNWKYAFNSKLKLHASGFIHPSIGELMFRGQWGMYWSSTQYVFAGAGRYLFVQSGASHMTAMTKAAGQSVRCLKDF